MFSNEKTSTQALLEAGPSSGSQQPTTVESHLKNIVVDNLSNVPHASTLSSKVPKPRPLNVADDFEIVRGVPAFVWGPQKHNPYYQIYAISYDGSHIAIIEDWSKICVYDMLDNFSLVAEWQDSSHKRIDGLTFHNNKHNELAVVFQDSTVALMHIAIKSKDAMERSKSSQPQFKRMEINAEFRILNDYKDINTLCYDIANEGCQTWAVAVDYSAVNTITMWSIIQSNFQKLQIKSKDRIAPMFSYCSLSQKALLLVDMREGGTKPLRTRVVHDLDFTTEVIDYSPRSIENGQSFGFSDCGRYFLTWRYIQDGEDALELYETQTLKHSLDPIAKKWLGHGVVTVRANFIKSTSVAIEMLGIDVQDSPIIAFIVARFNQVKLKIWAPTTNSTLKEIDLTMKEMTFSNQTHIEFCISPNLKWVVIGCWTDGIFGLFSILSGMQTWSIKLNTKERLIYLFIPFEFDASSTRLMINACDTLYVFCPPCVVEDYSLDFQSVTYDLVQDSKEQAISLAICHQFLIPKHILKKMLLKYHGLESYNIEELLDFSSSKHTFTIALLIHKNDALGILQGPFEQFFTPSFQEYFKSNWSQEAFPSGILEIKVERTQTRQSQSSNVHQYQSTWIFLYLNEEKNEDLIAVFLDQEGLHSVFINPSGMQSQERVPFWTQSCFAIKQSNDRSKVSCLFASGVVVVDLNQRRALYNVHYNLNLSRCLVPYITNRGESCFDVISDGEAIHLGWDTKNDRMLTLTSQMAEDEFKIMFEDEEIITLVHSFGGVCKAFAFLEFNVDNHKVSSICVHDVKGNSTKRITREKWNPQITRVLDSMTHEDLQKYTLGFDENNGQLWIIGLKQRDTTCHLVFLPISPYSMEGCVPSLYMRDYPRRDIVDYYELTSQFGISFFNMKFNGKTNFQLAFENKDKALMTKLLHYGNQHGLSLNDVFIGSFGEEFSNNFLKLAIENKNEAGVAFFFDLLEERTLPFEQGASMLKDEFSNLWTHYRSVLESRIMSNCLQRKICDVEIPIEVVGGSASTEARMGTINSIDDWEQAVNQGTIKTYYKSLHGDALEHIAKKGSNATNTAMVVIFTIASMCKLGLNGIIRPLLMLEAPSHVFGASLLKWVVEFKWNKIWKKRSRKTLLFYSVYMLIYSIYGIWMTLSRRHLGHDMVLRVCLSILLFSSMVLASILLYLECIQMKTYIQDGKALFPNDPMWGLRKYWRSGWTIVEVVSYIMVIIVIPSLHIANLLNPCVWSLLSTFIAVESILIWIKVWYFAQAFEKTGAFVLMIENIIKDCIPFLGLALVILLGFSFALFIFFQQALHEIKLIDNEDANNETRDIIEQSFGDPWKAIITMFYAMIGTFEPKIYHDSGSLSILITIMFVFYLATQMIVMVNMLIGIMGDTFDRVKSTKEEQLLMGRARFIDACEAQLSITDINAIESSIGEYLYVLLPKDEYVTNDIRLWQGGVKTIEDRVGRMIKDYETKVLKKIEVNNKKTRENTKQIKEDLTKLKEMKDDITKLKKMKEDISEVKQVKDSVEKMKGDIDEIKQILRNTITRYEGEIASK
eukprot:g7422.t1